MLDYKASKFFHSALQSGLIDQASLDACWQAIPEEKRVADAIDRRLARQAITAGHLTLWQAQQILGGRVNGFKIDRYILLDLLGRGGMGRVYLARDLRLNRRVAIKILSVERMNNPRAIARFQREAKVGAQLQHENLVRIYDEGEANGIRYLVMEYIQGKNIGQLIGELGSIPWPTAARLARQVALGLEHARLKGLIHRDVNPCNILVTDDGTAKLTDLGLAIDLADQDNVTRDGATVGTFDYVSPEQARHSRAVDTRADLYSLGCTLFHMISGGVPFPVASLPEKLYAHQLHYPEPLNELVPGVPEGLAALVRRLMSKNPDERQATPQVVALELEPFASEAGWQASGVAPAATVARASGPSAGTSVSPAPRETTDNDVPASWAPGSGPKTVGDLFAEPSGSASISSQGLGGPDSFFPLDLGPEVPLSEGLRATARASRSRSSSADLDGSGLMRRLWPWAAGLALLAMAGATAAFFTWMQPPIPAPAPVPPLANKVAPGHKKLPGKAVPPGDILVKGRDGRFQAVNGLPEAIALAVLSGGEVVLTTTRPFHLTNESPIIVPDGDPLDIHCADGVRAVLDVRIRGGAPLFLSRAPVRLKGLTIIAHRDEPTSTPVLQAERDLSLERCTFRAEGSCDGSRALLIKGARTTIVGCLFTGFDRPLDVVATPGASVVIRKSILLSELSQGRKFGGAIQLLCALGPADPGKPADEPACRLTVEECTIRAGSLAEVRKFAAAKPLSISVSGSAFQVRALLQFDFASEAPSPAALARAVLWEGRDNRFGVSGPGWVTILGKGSLPDGPANLKAWSALARENKGQAQTWKPAPPSPDPRSAHDYALVGEDDIVRGADPDQVGPR